MENFEMVPPKATSGDRLGRFREIISSPANAKIPRVPDAGMVQQVENNRQAVVMHNGLRVLFGSENGYYGDFAEILVLNRGVHEPQEELAFAHVLENIDTELPMIELGAYWGFYSLWYKHKFPSAQVHLVEPDVKRLQVGRDNFTLNALQCECQQGYVGKGGLPVDELIERVGGRVGILHADIQGHEMYLLESLQEQLSRHRINYLFVSTHSQDLHNRCRTILHGHGYRIIGSADFDLETYSFDGVLVAASPDSSTPPIELGSRSELS